MIYFHAVIEGDAKTGFSVFFPDLPGLAGAGDDLQSAALNASQGLAAHLELMIDEGQAVPTPSKLDDLVVDPDVAEAARILVPVDLPSTRAIRVNVTLPEDLVRRIDARTDNRSRFLAEAAEKALSAA